MIPYLLLGLAVLISALVLVQLRREGFIDPVPSSSATTKTGQGDQMNANWRQILTYLQQHPQNSSAFLQYLNRTFFGNCTIQPIDFSHLADTYTPLFT